MITLRGNVTYCSYVIRDEAIPASLLAARPLVPPEPGSAVVVVPAPGTGPGAWAGSPSAVLVDGEIFLAYRMRSAQERGYAVEVARSVDGVRFRSVVTIRKHEVRAESLERPSLAIAPDGSWRLYLSCATPGTKHWRVELMEAAAPDAFDPGSSRVLLPGSSAKAVKDPFILRHNGSWHLWASVHPLTDPDHTDRMTSEYATSQDGLDWTWQGTALAPRPGEWDARGARVASVRAVADGFAAYYDGRATAAENCEERTGAAVGALPGALTAVGDSPIAQSPAPARGLRYLTAVTLGGGRERIYYELTNTNGSHDLVTELRAA
jgi:hypothetical protein